MGEETEVRMANPWLALDRGIRSRILTPDELAALSG
jgi:hypothetical protein